MPECLIVQPIHRAGLDLLTAHGVTPRFASAPDMPTVAREIPGCAGVITRNAGLDAAAVEAGASLRVIVNHGVGMNRIAVDRATELGIPVCNTPTANARSVAEHAIALILALARKVMEGDAAVRSGDWRLRYEGRMMELHGKTLGLAGFGTIARITGAIARHGLGMRLLVFSPGSEDAALREAGAERAPSVEALLAGADVVSLHRPLRPDTRHMINADTLHHMRPHALLVNTARGELVDTAALAEALREGRLAGAAADVFAVEPPGAEEPLLSAPNTVLAPHIAGVTEEAMRETALQCAAQVLDVLAGRRPPHLVRPEVWERQRS
ncbi:hydroxyacid dehydrogenase [Falsiroseomonas oryziterrae]|uniref:hydroxyacid dehydrogenase n=1 Tax=Falsiroseomonas oryziterrae TaxID=2911368 RepID=UPI001F309BA3|nr:hydroxyacid dehydrogenase [Roseomonas sp. NPKOSM-4]